MLSPRPLTVHLKTGETIVGRSNYTTVEDVEIALLDGTFRTIQRTDIERVTR